MKISSQILILIILLFLSRANKFLSAPNFDIDQELSNILKNQSLMGFTVTIANEKGDLVYDKGFGYSIIEQKKSASKDTYYRIASISKSVATASLMTLYDQGLFSLDDDISNILGYQVRNPKFPNVPITVKTVLSHTSSIRDGSTYDTLLMDTYNEKNPSKIPDIRELLTPSGKYYSISNFGSQAQGYFAYSNLNFGICGTLVEKISKQRFDVYARKAVLSKLNLTASYNVADIDDWQNIATIYEGTNGTWVPSVDNFTSKPQQRNLTGYIPGTNGLIFGPQGGLNIKMNELIQINKMYANLGTLGTVKVLSDIAVQKMTSLLWLYNGNNGDTLDGLIRGYGLGIHITTNTINQDIVFPKIVMKGHTGFAYGLASNLWFDPKTKQCFVFAINGAMNGYKSSPTSAFLLAEQQIQVAVWNFLNNKQNIINE